MLGYLTLDGAGAADALIETAALDLVSRGYGLAGAYQLNEGAARDGRCHMDLRILGSGKTVRISQDLGPGSTGCRLDAGALEDAVGHVIAEIETGSPELLIVNKFGAQELEGRGFRSAIAAAMTRDIPVLIAVGAGHREGFLDFAGGLAEEVPAEVTAICGWAARATGRRPL